MEGREWGCSSGGAVAPVEELDGEGAGVAGEVGEGVAEDIWRFHA